jgi:hypothetical protein
MQIDRAFHSTLLAAGFHIVKNRAAVWNTVPDKFTGFKNIFKPQEQPTP